MRHWIRSSHPALLIVDTISGLGSIDYSHDDWGVGVTVAGSQKGLMLPPGLSFNALSHKALDAAERATFPRSYWDWTAILEANRASRFPHTPATNLLFGLDAALALLEEETLDRLFARHHRHAEATRLAVDAWGLEIYAVEPSERSNSLTAVLVPDGFDADVVRTETLDRYDMSLGRPWAAERSRFPHRTLRRSQRTSLHSQFSEAWSSAYGPREFLSDPVAC